MNIEHQEYENQRIQRALNTAKLAELQMKYGMTSFHRNEELPPEIEADFLAYVEEFEREYQNAKRISVREHIGNPTIRPVEELSTIEITTELDRLMAVMQSQNVLLDCICPVEPEELYRFITNELLDENINDMHINGMNWHFIYEEFHPNDDYDIKQTAEGMLRQIFERRVEHLWLLLSEDDLQDSRGTPVTVLEMRKRIDEAVERLAAITNHSITIEQCCIDGDDAVVEVAVMWEGLEAVTLRPVSDAGRAIIRLKRSRYGGWEVTQATIPGWEDIKNLLATHSG